MGTGTNWLKSLVGPAHARMWTECVNCEWYLYQAQFMTVQYEKEKNIWIIWSTQGGGIADKCRCRIWLRQRQTDWVSRGKDVEICGGIDIDQAGWLAGWPKDHQTHRLGRPTWNKYISAIFCDFNTSRFMECCAAFYPQSIWTNKQTNWKKPIGFKLL